MTGSKLLEVVYDILAQNEVSDEDREAVKEEVIYIDYGHSKIVFGEQHPRGLVETMDLRLYDHEEEEE